MTVDIPKSRSSSISKKQQKSSKVRKLKRMAIATFVVVFHVLGLLSSIHAIMSTRTEQGSVVWAVSLNTFPHVTVPAY